MVVTINYKVPRSRRPIWLLACIADFRSMCENFAHDNSSRIVSAFNECLNEQCYTLGCRSASRSCDTITRHYNENDNTITVMNVTGTAVLCVIEIKENPL